VIELSRARAGLLVVDLQDKLVPAMPAEIVARVIRNTAILIDAAARLGLPVIVSQQYPKGLGTTVAPIEAALAAAKPHRFDKTEFSTAATPEFAALAPRLGRDQWIVTGIETHVCVYQTARDLVARGSQAHVVTDAVCSRTKANWRVGLGLIERAGGIATSTEVVVFDLLGRAGGEDFKALSKAIK
jgi:nicotinamidase-related amidase